MGSPAKTKDTGREGETLHQTKRSAKENAENSTGNLNSPEKFDKDAGLSILAILLHNQLCHAPLCFARCNKPTDVMDWVPCIIRDASDGFLNHDEANAFMQALHAPVCYANIDVSTMDTRTSE